MKPESVRIDKWLWSVRVYKTRSLASAACRSGKVKIDDIEVKPSREVKLGDIVVVTINPQFKRTLKVLKLLDNRVSAKLVPDYAVELTPQEEYDKHKLHNELNWERRDRGVGRPTKKQRRDIDSLKDGE
nr:RNA-binding S4 domain-containing protein [Bacteroidota bacterium]